MKNKKIATLSFGGQEITLETGRLALQTNASVFASMGGTSLLVTVVCGGVCEDLDYFPLQVQYMEKLYAGGRIKGSRWVKRDGRPSDEEILTSRVIDRSIRPLFPADYAEEVQIIVTLLSLDMENDPDILGIIATSAALTISDIPWNGPIGAVRVGQINSEFVINPTFSQQETSTLDLILSLGPQGTVMIESGAKEVPEDQFFAALQAGEKAAREIIDFVTTFAKDQSIGKKTYLSTNPDQSLLDQIDKLADKRLDQIIKNGNIQTVSLELAALVQELRIELSEKIKLRQIVAITDKLFKKKLRSQTLKTKKRLDGRGPEDIRPLETEISVLSRTHGSALFQRGDTQALTITTLGSTSLKQHFETAEGEDSKRYLHHYSALPFSFGQVGRIGGAGRREIGHGALAERALEPVIPSEEDFPYTILVVSEIMSQNGSSSMASVCGSTLSLMDAGVPIKAPVAGISVGMISSSTEKLLITDIAGIEDFNGDMDFKVAGTETGITAVQLDIKTQGLDLPLIKDILAQARRARLLLLKKIAETIPAPRDSVSQYAPKVAMIRILPEKIGAVIGSGGKTIKALMLDTQTEINVEDDGAVSVCGLSKENVDKAIKLIEGLTHEVQPGETFRGPIKRIESFGVFVEYLPGRDGLVHVSKLSPEFVKDPSTIVSLGDKILVKVDKIDDMGRVDLSVPEINPSGQRAPRPDGPSRPPGNDRFSRGPRSFSPRPPRDSRPPHDSRPSYTSRPPESSTPPGSPFAGPRRQPIKRPPRR